MLVAVDDGVIESQRQKQSAALDYGCFVPSTAAMATGCHGRRARVAARIEQDGHRNPEELLLHI